MGRVWVGVEPGVARSTTSCRIGLVRDHTRICLGADIELAEGRAAFQVSIHLRLQLRSLIIVGACTPSQIHTSLFRPRAISLPAPTPPPLKRSHPPDPILLPLLSPLPLRYPLPLQFHQPNLPSYSSPESTPTLSPVPPHTHSSDS